MYPGRTTVVEVAKIVEWDTGFDLTPFIDAANELVTEVCSVVTKTDGVTPWHTESRLTLIETWLTAHFYCILDPRAQRERIGPITFEAQSKVDLGFSVTHYGQQAMRLDTSGALAALDKAVKEGTAAAGKFKATLKWLGNRALSGPSYSNN